MRLYRQERGCSESSSLPSASSACPLGDVRIFAPSSTRCCRTVRRLRRLGASGGLRSGLLRRGTRTIGSTRPGEWSRGAFRRLRRSGGLPSLPSLQRQLVPTLCQGSLRMIRKRCGNGLSSAANRSIRPMQRKWLASRRRTNEPCTASALEVKRQASLASAFDPEGQALIELIPSDAECHRTVYSPDRDVTKTTEPPFWYGARCIRIMSRPGYTRLWQ